ncbi:hypothetical protein VN97_g876 [Penicillium thymicola]|uniref:Uncharacterized protein n=1 Tax=Penicillium thymicola TaxID=293382 RepID=A0AAI9TRZ8_PENTH|nr:hypothetical protein VN97_g876 [Penicillium thymicola]
MWQTFIHCGPPAHCPRPPAPSLLDIFGHFSAGLHGSKYGRHLRFGYNCFPVTQLDALEVYDRHRRIGIILVVKNVVRTGVRPDNSDGPKSINGG